MLLLLVELVEMSNLLLGNLQVFGRLGRVLAGMLLLLVELVEHLILVGDLIVETADGVVPVGLLLLQLLDGHVDILNVLLDDHTLGLEHLLVGGGLLAISLHLSKFVLGCSKDDLQVSLLGRGLGLSLMVLGEVSLGFGDFGQESFLLGFNRHVVLLETSLGLELFIISTIGGVGLFLQKSQLFLWVRLADHRPGLLDEDKPSPASQLHVFAEVPLGHDQQLPLVPLLEIGCILDPLQDLSLEEANQLKDNVVTSLLETG